MNKIEQLTWLIEQNKKKREELKQKEQEYKTKREAVLQRLKKEKSDENQRKLSTITQKLSQVSQSLLEVRRKNKELQRERSIVYKSIEKKKKSRKLAKSSDETKLSSHSIVQYLDRGRGMDIESIREEVSNSADTQSNGTITTSGTVGLDDVSYTANNCTTNIGASNTATFDSMSLFSSSNMNENSRIYSSEKFDNQTNSGDTINEESSNEDVSDFEVVNYLSNTGAIDLEEVKKEIIDDDVEPLINSDELIGSSGTFTNSSGYRLVVKNGTVVTVLPKKGDEKDKKPKKRRKRKKKGKKK